MSLIEQARASLEGVTPGPWVFDDHEDADYDTVTVGAGTFLETPGVYTGTDLIVEVDTYGMELDEVDYRQVTADAKFIAAARTLVPALIIQLEAAREIAENRLDLIEELKAENRRLKHEVNRLTKASVPDTVTRVTVVKNSGIVLETFAGQWRMFIQDDGRTVKLFGVGDGFTERHERDEALGRDLVAALHDVGYLKKERRIYCQGCGGGFVGAHDCGRKQ